METLNLDFFYLLKKVRIYLFSLSSDHQLCFLALHWKHQG